MSSLTPTIAFNARLFWLSTRNSEARSAFNIVLHSSSNFEREKKVNKKPIIRSIALIIVFCAVGFILFTDNVRTVQILGLFACGAVVGATLTSIKVAIKSKKNTE